MKNKGKKHQQQERKTAICCKAKKPRPLPHCCRHRENRVENYCDVDRTIATEEGCLTCTTVCQHKRERSKNWICSAF